MQNGKKFIAFVCSGNTCRSPMAEGIFNMLAEEKGLNVKAESFGVHTVTGLPVSNNSVIVCKEIGLDLTNKRALLVSDTDIDKYEKFYCMSVSHSIELTTIYGIPAGKIKIINVSDPFGGSVEIYRQCREQIYNSILEIINDYEN